MKNLCLFVLVVLFGCITSCVTVYYPTGNPTDAPTVTLPPEMYGAYITEGNDYLRITKDTLEVYIEIGGVYQSYKGAYGPGTGLPFYKIDSFYLFGYPCVEGAQGYYRIFLLECKAGGGKIDVRELFGRRTGNEKKKLMEQMDNVSRLNMPAKHPDPDNYIDFLFNPASGQFKKLVKQNAFETILTFYKNGVSCEETEALLYAKAADGWKKTDLRTFDDPDWIEKLNKNILFFKNRKTSGTFEFVVINERQYDYEDLYNGNKYFYRVKIVCRE